MYRLKIITPQGVFYDQSVTHAVIPAEDGFVGVLTSHAPYVTSSLGGWLRVDESKGSSKRFRVGPGFFTVAKNQASFLTDSVSA